MAEIEVGAVSARRRPGHRHALILSNLQDGGQAVKLGGVGALAFATYPPPDPLRVQLRSPIVPAEAAEARPFR